MMKISYDSDADAMYITLKEGEFAKNVVLDDDTILDYDKEGNLLGIEILFLKERCDKEDEITVPLPVDVKITA